MHTYTFILYCAMLTKLSIQLLINVVILKSSRYFKITTTENLRGIIRKKNYRPNGWASGTTNLDAEKNML